MYEDEYGYRDNGRKRLIIIALCLVCPILLIIAIVVVVTSVNPTSAVKFVNRESLLANNKTTITLEDFQYIGKVIKDFVASDKERKVGFREASYSEETTTYGSTRISFMVDIIDSGATYSVDYEKRPGKENKMSLTCVSRERARNPDAFCSGTDASTSLRANLDDFLPYSPEGEFKNKYALDFKGGSANRALELKVFAQCDDSAAFDRALEDAKKALKNYGVNPGTIQIELSHDYCYK